MLRIVVLTIFISILHELKVGTTLQSINLPVLTKSRKKFNQRQRTYPFFRSERGPKVRVAGRTVFSPAERDRPARRRTDPSYPAFRSSDQVTNSYRSGPVTTLICLTQVITFSASCLWFAAKLSHSPQPCSAHISVKNHRRASGERA